MKRERRVDPIAPPALEVCVVDAETPIADLDQWADRYIALILETEGLAASTPRGDAA